MPVVSHVDQVSVFDPKFPAFVPKPVVPQQMAELLSLCRQ